MLFSCSQNALAVHCLLAHSLIHSHLHNSCLILLRINDINNTPERKLEGEEVEEDVKNKNKYDCYVYSRLLHEKNVCWC